MGYFPGNRPATQGIHESPASASRSESQRTRQFSALVFGALVALVLAGCGGTQPSATQPSAAAAPTAATSASPAATAAPSTAATASSAATPATSSTPASAATAGAATPVAGAAEDTTPKVVAATNAFLATLSDTEKNAVLFDWTDTAQKQRWSNLPEGLYTRAGLMWGNLSEAQQNAWLAVMQATLSTEGYNRVMAEWNADDVLAAEGSGGGGPGGQLLFGKKYYWIAIIGTPSETDAWQWQWGGHHVTVNATVAGTNIALTPSFIGCQPCEYTDGSGTTVRPLGDIEDEAFALVNSLDATQQGAAILGSTSIDLVLGPGQDDKTIQAEGLPAEQMNAGQKAALLKLIGHYTGLVNDEDAAARTAEIQAGLDQTSFAWYGPTTEGSAAYFRITGPSIVIELAPQGGGGNGLGLGGSTTANHLHGIYRDPSNEYGAKYTQ